VAQALLEQPPRMFNHARGLWGYTGTAPDGELLTVQATGIGGPSTAIVCEELIGLGARTLVRIGTCGALVTTELAAAIPASSATAALTIAAGTVGLASFLIALAASAWLPEPRGDALPE